MDVLISGAGVAGPALAYWLRHHGFTPTVIERAPRARGGGYAVDLRGEALDVLDRMALLDRVEAVKTPTRGMAMVDRDGDAYAFLPVAGDPRILRDDLSGLLHEATRHEVEYVFGDSITGLEQDAGGVRATFERGRPRRFDLVAGADGLHSRTRRLAFGPERRFARHLGIHTAVFGLPDHLGLRETGLLYSAPGRAAGVLGVPGAGARAALHFASGPLGRDRGDPGWHKRVVAERFAGEGWQIPRLLAEMDRAEDFFFDANAQIEMDRWSAGRVVLLGDAGHCAAPASGHGPSQALIGAYVLAGELAAAGGDHAVAFAAYEREMRGFVAEHQQAGREGADRFFLGALIQQEPGPITAGPITAGMAQPPRTRLVRLKDYAPGLTTKPR
ncbi:FAD-dependent monooxygenase [Nonomuraea sp. NPDC050783]|uniref:FAD-dependent monooxygenase n=1 Tax=Nonomuraea sp. NPDC050783 TaxID=3154634 RepID=UPI0034650DC1